VRFLVSLSLAGLATAIAFVVAGAAFARQNVRPGEVASVRALRATVDHYRSLAWTYQRAAQVRRTPTAYSDRRTSDRVYLRWTVGVWTHRASAARDAALFRVHRRFDVAVPKAPGDHSALPRRVSYARRMALRLRRIFPGGASRSFASARGSTDAATLALWQRRLAAAALGVLRHGYARPPIPRYLSSAFLCIHHYEGGWSSNTGNGYYGGLQMDIRFQRIYGADYLRRWGTADRWPAWAQLVVASRAYRAGRGFAPWPNTARACGLL
jgi:Transglycosylase-like domain